MAKDFTGTTVTKSGVKVKDVKFLAFINRYTGMVWDDGWAVNIGKDTQWLSCSWTKSGKCVNRTRTDLDL